MVVTDVDGTLVQPDKSLAPSTAAAAHRLAAAGIPLGIVSARPTFGLHVLAQALSLDGLLAGFNGGVVATPDGTAIARRLLSPDAVHAALDLFARRGISAWLFTETEWLATDPNGPRIPLERHTIGVDERIVPSLAAFADQCGKVVGVCDDEPLLAATEQELQALLGTTANAKRSQTYYLDVTHPEANKGNAVRILAGQLGIDVADVAVLGDMANDLPMFAVAGFSIAMGNGTAEVQAAASAVTARNDADGWAQAIDRYVLGQTGAMKDGAMKASAMKKGA